MHTSKKIKRVHASRLHFSFFFSPEIVKYTWTGFSIPYDSIEDQINTIVTRNYEISIEIPIT